MHVKLENFSHTGPRCARYLLSQLVTEQPKTTTPERGPQSYVNTRTHFCADIEMITDKSPEKRLVMNRTFFTFGQLERLCVRGPRGGGGQSEEWREAAVDVAGNV